MDWLIGCIALIHLVIAPFTKVEESFNLQACHDILYNGLHLNEYDHLEFPGAVPRTFVGPIIVSAIAYPFAVLIKFFGLSKLFAQYVVRGILGLLVIFAWRRFRKQLQDAFGSSVTFWFTLVTASQFHFMYYLSRPLPNTFALAVALLAFSYWLEQRHAALIWTCAIAVLIFRSELCLLLGPMLLADLATRKLLTVPFLKHAIPAGFVCLATTIVIDSFLWGRLLWPEGEVFWFNTYKNQSQNWGTSPFLWYWYSALPRALGLSLPLIPVGVALDKRVQVLVTPAIIFVTAYSFLPHKELRFIIYVFPIFNVAVARACHYFWAGREKSGMRQFFAVGSALHLLGNISFTTLLLIISANNYPGGLAIHKLHQVVPYDAHVNVHIDNFAAQTGVTRFTQLYDHWKYNKTDKFKAGGETMRGFTHILVEAKSKYSYNLKHYTTSHKVLNQVEAFSHLSFNYQQFPPVKVRVKPAIFLLQNIIEEDIDWSLFEVKNEDKLDENEKEVEELLEGELGGEIKDDMEDEEEQEVVPEEDERSHKIKSNLDIADNKDNIEMEEEEKDNNRGVKEDIGDAEVEDSVVELLTPKLPDGGCFAPQGDIDISEAPIDSYEDNYADTLSQSEILDGREDLEEISGKEAEEELNKNELDEESTEDFCFDCERTEKRENILQVHNVKGDSDIPVNSQEEIVPEDRYLEENGGDRQTVFVEMASHLDEEMEVSAKELDSETQITSP